MAKKIKTVIKLQIPAGQANPAPPVGPALGQHGLNIAEFCQKFNEATRSRQGEITPVEITVYDNRSYDFITKISPVAELLKQAAKIQKGSGESLKKKVGKITKAQVRQIAEKKMPDLNANDIEGAMKMVEGTAKQMGLEIID
ncbi:MAG: 50S ribosomal protein L11 [Candidatus Buchananbacteria bacterium]